MGNSHRFPRGTPLAPGYPSSLRMLITSVDLFFASCREVFNVRATCIRLGLQTYRISDNNATVAGR